MGQIIEKSRLISILLFIAVIVVASAFLLDSINLTSTDTTSSDDPLDEPTIIEIEEHEMSLSHGALGDSTGCASCHTQPITSGSCTSAECHPNPPTVIGPNQDIDFQFHHDLTSDCSISACHDCAGDYRYVAVVDASHGYCGITDCHDDMTHS